VSQLLMAAPMILLFEAGILAARFFEAKPVEAGDEVDEER